jgi:hypothetical protein
MDNLFTGRFLLVGKAFWLSSFVMAQTISLLALLQPDRFDSTTYIAWVLVFCILFFYFNTIYTATHFNRRRETPIELLFTGYRTAFAWPVLMGQIALAFHLAGWRHWPIYLAYAGLGIGVCVGIATLFNIRNR